MGGILIINDVHIADRPPLGRIEGYTDQIMAKLEECRQLAREQGCDVTLWTGDFFHNKRPSFVSHALMQRLLDLLREWPGRKYIVVGNHDMSEAGMASLPRQPLGVLLRAGVLELLPEDGVTIEVGGRKVYLEASHYADTMEPEHYALQGRGAAAKGADVRIKVVHGAIMPPGADPPFEHINADKIPARADYCFYGHIHDVHGTYAVDACTYVNFGSVGRVARTGENRKRAVSVALYDPVADVVKRHVLKSVLPAAEVFIAVETEAVEGDDDLKAYARELAHALQQGSSASIEDLLVGAFEGVVDDEVRAAVKGYLVTAGL